MTLKTVQRYLGLATVVLLWGSVGYGINKVHLNIFGTAPISKLGTLDSTAFIFSGGLILAAVCTMVFAYYLSTVFVVKRNFITALTIGQIGQVILALVHYGGKQPDRAIHTVAALTLAFSIPIALRFFANSQPKGVFKKRAYLLYKLELTAFIIGIGLFTFVLNGAPFTQMMPAVGFHVWLIYTSFAAMQKTK